MTPRFVLWLDRDGTIVDDPGYLSDPDALRLLPGAAEALALLRAAGGFIALITNQSGIARGYMTRETVDEIHRRLREQLRRGGADLDAIYICPHLPPDQMEEGAQPCDCRKPRPGMVEKALSEHELGDLPAFVIGDKLADLGLADAVGAKAILVRSGDGTGAERALASSSVRADAICDDVLEAANWILRQVGAE